VLLVEEEYCVLQDFTALLPTVMMMALLISAVHKVVVLRKEIPVIMVLYATGD